MKIQNWCSVWKKTWIQNWCSVWKKTWIQTLFDIKVGEFIIHSNELKLTYFVIHLSTVCNNLAWWYLLCWHRCWNNVIILLVCVMTARNSGEQWWKKFTTSMKEHKNLHVNTKVVTRTSRYAEWMTRCCTIWALQNQNDQTSCEKLCVTKYSG